MVAPYYLTANKFDVNKPDMGILYTLTLNMSTLWKAYAFHLAKGVDIFSISCVLFICGRVGCVAHITTLVHVGTNVLAL